MPSPIGAFGHEKNAEALLIQATSITAEVVECAACQQCGAGAPGFGEILAGRITADDARRSFRVAASDSPGT